jgi:hypothetical protein
MATSTERRPHARGTPNKAQARSLRALSARGYPFQIVRLRFALVADVERVAQCLVETTVREFVEVANGLVVEAVERDCDDVDATDDARFGKAVFCTEFDFGSVPTNGACDRRASH